MNSVTSSRTSIHNLPVETLLQIVRLAHSLSPRRQNNRSSYQQQLDSASQKQRDHEERKLSFLEHGRMLLVCRAWCQILGRRRDFRVVGIEGIWSFVSRLSSKGSNKIEGKNVRSMFLEEVESSWPYGHGIRKMRGLILRECSEMEALDINVADCFERMVGLESDAYMEVKDALVGLTRLTSLAIHGVYLAPSLQKLLKELPSLHTLSISSMPVPWRSPSVSQLTSAQLPLTRLTLSDLNILHYYSMLRNLFTASSQTLTFLELRSCEVPLTTEKNCELHELLLPIAPKLHTFIWDSSKNLLLLRQSFSTWLLTSFSLAQNLHLYSVTVENLEFLLGCPNLSRLELGWVGKTHGWSWERLVEILGTSDGTHNRPMSEIVVQVDRKDEVDLREILTGLGKVGTERVMANVSWYRSSNVRGIYKVTFDEVTERWVL